MLSELRSAALLLALFTLFTGVLYPVAMTGIAQGLFAEQANGSLLQRDGAVTGSALIGQPFHDVGYFWGRPSATSGGAYNAAASSGSNLGPTNPALLEAVRERVAQLRAADPSQREAVPVDLITASGSGLDPHISPAAAYYQVRRVAHARKLPEADVRALVRVHTEGRTLGLWGEPRVNVLRLNLALDVVAQPPAQRAGEHES
jgi:potassium-transporting ATPase KdpC subunit